MEEKLMGKWEWGSHFNPTIMRIIGILSVEYLWGIISHHFSNVSLGGVHLRSPSWPSMNIYSRQQRITISLGERKQESKPRTKNQIYYWKKFLIISVLMLFTGTFMGATIQKSTWCRTRKEVRREKNQGVKLKRKSVYL